MSMYFRLDHGKPAAHHNIDSIALLMRLVGYKAKTSNPTYGDLAGEFPL